MRGKIRDVVIEVKTRSTTRRSLKIQMQESLR